MTKIYELMLLKEVLLEIGAGVCADCCMFKDAHEINADKNPDHPVVKLEQAVWAAKKRVLQVQTVEELERLQGCFDFARDYLQKLGYEHAS